MRVDRCRPGCHASRDRIRRRRVEYRRRRFWDLTVKDERGIRQLGQRWDWAFRDVEDVSHLIMP